MEEVKPLFHKANVAEGINGHLQHPSSTRTAMKVVLSMTLVPTALAAVKYSSFYGME